MRVQLSMVLHTVVSQQLVPDVDGGLVPAFEIMHVNNAIRSLIRDSKTHQIDSAIAAGAGEGMISMDQSILKLYRGGKITRETALDYAEHPEQLNEKNRRIDREDSQNKAARKSVPPYFVFGIRMSGEAWHPLFLT